MWNDFGIDTCKQGFVVNVLVIYRLFCVTLTVLKGEDENREDRSKLVEIIQNID